MMMESHCNSSDIKLFCFFCLRSNSRKYSNPQDESESGENTEKESVSSFHEFSLRNLYRFLNLLHSDKEEKDFQDLKMPICGKCFGFNGEFNKLYNLLEETKLRLNWCLQKLRDVMTKANSGNESRLSFQVELMDVNDEKILEIWRTHTLDRMKTVTVTVTVTDDQDTMMQPSLFVDQPGLEDEDMKKVGHEDVSNPCSVLSEMSVLFTETEIADCELKIKMDCDAKVEEPYRENSSCLTFEARRKVCRKRRGRPPISNTSSRVKSLPFISQKTKRLTKCNHCSYVCGADIRGRKTSMMRHQVRFHPEHLLLDKSEMDQVPECRPERLRQILTDYVFPKYLISSRGRNVSCSLCRRVKYKSKNMNQNIASVRQHLVFQHKTELKQDLNIVLEDEGLIKRESRREVQVHSSHCPYCSFKSNSSISSRPGSMACHLIRFHPEHYLIDEKDKEKGLWHEQFRNILNKMVYPKFILSDGKHRSCSMCGAASQSRNARGVVKRHLILRHKMELKESFKAVLDDPGFEEKLSNCNKTKKSRCQTQKQIFTSNCPYCDFKRTSSASASPLISSSLMTTHLVHFHPEHYLIDEKDKAGGLWHEQFRTILTKMIYPDCILKVGHYRSCSLCEVIYHSDKIVQNQMDMKKHLIFNHKAELKEKFRYILETSSFEKRINGSHQRKKKQASDVTVTGCSQNTKNNATKAKTEQPVSSDCPYCVFECEDSTETEKHLMQFHLEHLLFDENDRYIVSGIRPEQFQTILTDIVMPKFSKITEQHVSCSLCDNQKYDRSNVLQNNVRLLQRHLLSMHKTRLKEDFRIVLEDVLFGECLNTTTCTLKDLAPSSIDEQNHQVSPNCPYCRFNCNPNSSISSIERHIVRFHPEHFLVDEGEKPNEIPELISHPHFQRILMNMVFPKLVLVIGLQTKCSLCNMKYTVGQKYENIVFARKHLLAEHNTELIESIKDVLEDPLQLEKLDSSGESGVTCTCGVYFSHSERAVLTYHDKFHCIQAPNRKRIPGESTLYAGTLVRLD